MTTNVGHKPLNVRPSHLIPEDRGPIGSDVASFYITKAPWLSSKRPKEIYGSDYADVNLRPELNSGRVFCVWASSPAQYSAMPMGTANASHGSLSGNTLVTASDRIAENFSTVDGLEFHHHTLFPSVYARGGELWSAPPEHSLPGTHAGLEPGQHWASVGLGWQTASDHTIGGLDASLGRGRLGGGWAIQGDVESSLPMRIPVSRAAWRAGSATATAHLGVIEPTWEPEQGWPGGTPGAIAATIVNSAQFSVESPFENLPMVSIAPVDLSHGWVLQSDKALVGHVLNAFSRTSRVSFGSGGEEAKTLQDFATMVADFFRKSEPSPSSLAEWELEAWSVIEAFSAGAGGETPDPSTIAMARRVVRVAYQCTHNTFISVDDEEGDLDFDLRLNNGFIVMANVFSDGTIDASVYDDSDGIPVKTVKRFRRGQTTEEDLVSLFRTESNANTPQSHAVSFHQEPQELLAPRRGTATSAGI